MKNSEMKSKVMSLGNRLAPRMSGDRKVAFIQAWAIVKAGGTGCFWFMGLYRTQNLRGAGCTGGIAGNKGRGVLPRTHKNILRITRWKIMWFEYKGFTVHRLDLYWYLILGPYGYRGYETSTNAARKTIDGVIAGQCVE